MRRRRNGFDYPLFIKKNLLGLTLVVAACFLLNTARGFIIPKDIVMSDTIPYFNFGVNDPYGQYKLYVAPDGGVEDVFAGDSNNVPHYTSLVGIDDISWQPETDIELIGNHVKENLTVEDIENLKNIDFLKKTFYIVDKRTDISEDDIDVDEFLNMDFTMDTTTQGPKVLIFHTHSMEGFADSDMTKDMNEGIWGVGERLKNLLEEKYGIEVIHDSGRYDMVDGAGHLIGAYERMEPSIQKILDENPSIELVIDMHRDGVNENTRLVTEIDGKQCAQIMFFNGLCKVYKDGVLTPISNLENPYVKENMGLSFNLQLTANSMYPSFTRKVYVNAYRYSLHMKPKSLLIEVGAQTNTKEEALNAMEPLSDILASVLLSGE